MRKHLNTLFVTLEGAYLRKDGAAITPAGKSRLRRVAKTCLDYGQRVQNSVFECKVNPAQLVIFKAKLLDIIDPETDSLRFYHLGSNWQHKVEHHGANEAYDVDGTLII